MADLEDIEDLGTCSCSRCAALCVTVPGRFSVEDAIRLEAHLGIDEMQKKVISVSGPLHGEMWRMIRPRIVDEEGATAPFVSHCGPCSFLTDTGCSLDKTTGKPIECRQSYACSARKPDNENVLNMIDEWSSPRGKALLARLDAATPAPLLSQLVEAKDEAWWLDTPYGFLAARVQSIYEQSVFTLKSNDLKKKWIKEGTISNHVQKGELAPLDLASLPEQHWAYVKKELRETALAFKDLKKGQSEEQIESSRKVWREALLATLHKIDDLVFYLESADSGRTMYLVRAWTETLTRP